MYGAALASSLVSSSSSNPDESGASLVALQRLATLRRTGIRGFQIVGNARTRSGILQIPKSGRMRVVLNVWGGTRGLAAAVEGLVQRNLRAFRQNPTYLDRWGKVKVAPDNTVWRDVPSAIADGVAGNGTVAAATAAVSRMYGNPGRVTFIDGLPTVDGSPIDGARYDYEPEEGRTDERMIVTIDDDRALPVREINTAIARHNAWEIEHYDLPSLYSGRVRYQVEGSPELWWSSKEIHDRTYDDCEGLAAYRAGELILMGYDAEVYTRLIQKPDKGMGGSGKGGRLFHAITLVKGWTNPETGRYEVVRNPDGTRVYDDPSVRLGMPVPGWYSQFAADMRAKGWELG